MNKSAIGVHGIFPTPIVIDSLGRSFTKKELACFEDISKSTTRHAGNIGSTDTYVLERPELAKLKADVSRSIQKYMDEVLCSSKNLRLRITQSWTNYTSPGEHHHPHSHPNSFLSGVLYLDADIAHDKIYFEKKDSNRFAFNETSWNLYNSRTWWFPVETGNIVLFPSGLSHKVDTTTGPHTRVSLAFNTFFEGDLGSASFLTELKL